MWWPTPVPNSLAVQTEDQVGVQGQPGLHNKFDASLGYVYQSTSGGINRKSKAVYDF